MLTHDEAVIMIAAICWLVTVAGFLLYVRSLRDKHSLAMRNETVSGLIKQAEVALSEQYDHQPDDARFVPSKLPAMTAPIERPAPEVVAAEEDKAKAEASRDAPTLPKIPRGWKKADGKTRHVRQKQQMSVRVWPKGGLLGKVPPLQGVNENALIANGEQYDHQPDDARFEPEPIKIPRDWKKADGKTRHVKRGRLSIIMRDGFRDDNAEASAYHSLWHHDELLSDWDIIAYRVCKPKKRVTVKKRGKK